MTKARAKPLGWAVGERLTSTQMNTLDAYFPDLIDGADGGTWNPSAAIVIGGSGFQVNGKTTLTDKFDTSFSTPLFGAQSWRKGEALPGSLTLRGGDLSKVYQRWFAAGGSDQAAYSDDDGLTWTAIGGMSSTVNLQDIAVDAGNAAVVAVGSSATGYRSSSLTSPSMSSFTFPGSPTVIQAVKSAGSLLCAAGVATSDPYIATSTNGGSSWTERSAPAGFAGLTLHSIAMSGSTIVIASSSAHTKLAVSTDSGATWADSTTTLTSGIYQVVYNASLSQWLAVGMGAGTDAIYTSSDGDTWASVGTGLLTSMFDNERGGTRRGLATYGDGYMICGDRATNQAKVAFSFDATTWRPVAFFSGSVYTLIGTNGHHVLVGSDSGNNVYSSMRREGNSAFS